MRDCDNHDLSGLRLKDHAVRKTPKYGKAVLVVVSGKHLRTGVDKRKNAVHLCFKPQRCLGTPRLLPGQGGLIFRLRFRMKKEVSHLSLPWPYALLRPTGRPWPGLILVLTTGAE
jgi:hypothetical protein